MVQGAQTNATGFVAIALESTSGSPEAAPQTSPNGYIVLRGDMAPVTKKPPKLNEVAGQIFPTLPVPGPESYELSLPMFPILAGNGLGPLLASCLGDDTISTLVGGQAYQHLVTWENLILTFTEFCHYGTLDDDQYRMCAVDSIDIKSKSSDNSLEIDVKTQGTSLEKLSTGAVATDQFIDPDSANTLTHAGLLVEFGQPAAAFRGTVEELTANIKRNLVFGCLGKPGQHPAGSASHNIVNSKKSNFELKLTGIDTDREEILRAMDPTNADPGSPTRFTDVLDFVKGRFTWYGESLYAGINGEADYCNAGTIAGTFGGSYTGSSTVTVGEIMMSDSDIYETALGDDKDLSMQLLDTDATYEVETGSGLAVTLTSKDILVTLGAEGSTASAILAALLAKEGVPALMSFTLANGSDGTGVVTLAQTKITSTSFKDGFKYRYTTGGAWSSWTNWIKVTESAQDLVSGIQVTFDDDTKSADGDIFRFCSHYREMLRLTAPYLAYKDVPKTTFKDGKRMIDIELATIDTNTEADRPFITVWNSESVAFDTAA